MHPNTVRYRLRRVADVIGWDATHARDALIVQSALILGAMSESSADAGACPTAADRAVRAPPPIRAGGDRTTTPPHLCGMSTRVRSVSTGRIDR